MIKNIIDITTKSLLDKSNFIASLDHSLEKGMHREFFVTEVLQPLLPQQYGITSGIIFDHSGKQSTQLDIIIFDKRKLPPLMMRDGAGIVPLDSALIVIEVKSLLTSPEITTCINSGSKLSPIYNGHLEMSNSNLQSHYPLYCIFAYKSDAVDKCEFLRADESYANQFKSGKIVPLEDSGSGSDIIRLISVLNKGVWGLSQVGGKKSVIKRTSNNELLNMRNFIWMLLDRIESTASSRHPYKISDWFGIE